MKNQPPALSRENLLRYQRIASERRAEYAQAKSYLRHGKRTLASVLDDPELKRMRVRDVIASLPVIGKAGALKVMDELGISRARRVQGLGIRQRERLVERMGSR